MSSNNMLSEKMEYTFVDLYKNNNAVGLTFMISGDKYINTYRLY